MATIKQIKDSAGTTHDIVDTKNTAGSTNSSSKLYLIGAASQAANPQTYSNSNCYTSDGRLYSSGITSTDNLVLSNNSTEPPKIIFQRNTSTDDWYDFQLSGGTGGFKFGYSLTSGQGSVTNIATIDSNGNYSGNAATATTATMASKLGSSTIGASNRPIYLNAGTPTACNVGEAFLTWGGKDFSGSYGPIDAAMIPNLGANRLAFAKPAGIYIEYSRDGGATWIDYEASDSQKICLTTTTTSAAFTLGKNTVKGESTSDYMLRITFASGSCNVYTQINKFAIYVSTNGSSLSDASNNMRCTLQIAKNGSENTFTDIKTVNLSGWSGWNIINTSLTMSGNASHTTYANKVRFIFSHDSCNASYLGGSVYRIFGYGGVGWTTPSTLASTGDLYSYDTNQNMIIPTGLYSNSTTGTSNLGLSSRYWKDGYINNLYIGGSAGNTTSKITSDTKTNMYISVNGKIPFVIDASDSSNPKIRASSSLPSTVSLGTSSVPFKDVYADKFNGYTIEKSVPSNAVFTDTVYEHPTSAGNKHIPSGGSTGQYLKYSGTSGTATWATPPDTKNTAGSTNSSSKLFLIGATEQSANPQTYSHDTAYVDTDGCLYSNSKKVITVSDTVTTTTDGIMSSTDKNKLNAIEDKAQKNVQSDWNVTDSTSDAFIKNKPAKNVIYNTHTNGQVAKFDTTTGTITASGYTIAKSVPSDAVFTDTVYEHPTSAGNKHIPSGGSTGQYLKYSSSGTATWATPPDTKNTAGSTNSSSKLFLIGATSQAANPQTYSHDTAYVGTDGCLYSNSKKVITVSDMATTTIDGIMSSEDKTKLNNCYRKCTITVNMSSSMCAIVPIPVTLDAGETTSAPQPGERFRVKIVNTAATSGTVTMCASTLKLQISLSNYYIKFYNGFDLEYDLDGVRYKNQPVFTEFPTNGYIEFGIFKTATKQYYNDSGTLTSGTVYCAYPISNPSVGSFASMAYSSVRTDNINAYNAPTTLVETYYLPVLQRGGTDSDASNGSPHHIWTDSSYSLTYDTTKKTVTKINVPSLTCAGSATLGSYTNVTGMFNIKENNQETIKIYPGNTSTVAPYIYIGKSNASAANDNVGIKMTGMSTAASSKSKIILYGLNSSTVVNTTITAGSTELTSSDERLKDFLDDIPIDFNDLKQLPKKYFVWKDDSNGDLQIGTSAQAVEKIYPELVKTDENGYKSLEYAKLSIIALAAIDKLNERIEYLENKLKELE